MSTRILVVDDELDTLSLLRTILEIGGFQPITTLNSVDAIGLAEMEKPDVVLLDIMMPKLDGFTLCKMMRENPATRSLPIIFVTAYEALDIEDRRVEAGADLLIQKPINVDELLTSIGDAIEARAMSMAEKEKTDQPAADDKIQPEPVTQSEDTRKPTPSKTTPSDGAAQAQAAAETQNAPQAEKPSGKPDSKA